MTASLNSIAWKKKRCALVRSSSASKQRRTELDETRNPVELAATERQLRRLIVAPSGVGAILEELGEAEAQALALRIRSDATLSAVERLEVYANAYFYRIHDCLIEDFGALHAALGAEFFHDLVTAYLIVHPPRHPSMRFAGDRLAEYLLDAPSAKPFRHRLPWAGDLARLEWALRTSFDAADAAVVSRDDLVAIAPEDWAGLVFEFAPAYTLLKLGWPVDDCRRAWERDSALPDEPLEPKEIRICVWRREERVRYRRVDGQEADALIRAARGESFGALCEGLASELGDGEAPARAAAYLKRWQADGLLGALSQS